MGQSYLQSDRLLLGYLDRSVTLSGTVASDPTIKNGTLRVTINNVYLNYSTKCEKSQAYAILSLGDFELSRSDQLTLEGVLQGGFGDYAGFMYKPKLVAIGKPSPPDYANHIKQFLTRNIQRQIDDATEHSLALGYLVGDKSNMPSELSDALKYVGLAHITVASGFHLGVVVGLAKKYLRKISRFLTLAASTILLICFVAVAGFSPSLLRAAIAILIALLCWYFGERMHPGRTLCYMLAVSLLINPQYLHNLAWQLSFASYAGIVLVAPVITVFLHGDHPPGLIASSIIQSFSAQLLCLPIMIYNFGHFSILGVFLNLIISPTIPIVMLLSLALGLTGLNLPAIPLRLLLRASLNLIYGANGLAWGSVNIANPSPLIFLIYLPIIGLWLALCRLSGFRFRRSPNLEKAQKHGKIYT